MSRLFLIRHTAVAKHWTGHCYGQLDVGLSRKGRAHITEVLKELTPYPIDLVIHSGLQRTSILARRLAQQRGIECFMDTLWQERGFGTWEGKSWNRIYKETGNAMDGMLTAPKSFRPGGGETTQEMRERALTAVKCLPKAQNIAVITHGGPIAALIGTAKNRPIPTWPDLIPQLGSITKVKNHGASFGL